MAVIAIHFYKKLNRIMSITNKHKYTQLITSKWIYNKEN